MGRRVVGSRLRKQGTRERPRTRVSRRDAGKQEETDNIARSTTGENGSLPPSTIKIGMNPEVCRVES